MSDSNHALSVTLKGGEDFDSPWIVVYGNAPDEVAAKLEAVVNGGLIEATVIAANALKGANNAAPLLPQGQEAQQQAPAQPAQQQPWGQQPPVQQQAPQQQGGGNRFGGQQHPEGKQCEVCSNVLELKTTGNGKKKWQCSQWRWNNGNPNNHTVEWVNG
jgi:hypothetical protein